MSNKENDLRNLHIREAVQVANPNPELIPRARFIGDRLVTVHLTRKQVADEERRKRMAQKAWDEADNS